MMFKRMSVIVVFEEKPINSNNDKLENTNTP